MATIKNDRDVLLRAPGPRFFTAGLASGLSVYKSLDDSSWSSNVPLVTVADGPAGTTARRSLTGVDTVFNQTALFQIDRTRTYKVRFWARAVGANGVLYHTLRQFLPNGSVGPDNAGRSPYKPAAVNPALTTAWTEFSYTWNVADWQTGVTQVRPDFLLNYRDDAVPRTGYWELQDYRFWDVTEVVAAQADAAVAMASLTAIFADNVLSRDEKTEIVRRLGEKDGEFTGIVAQAAALSVSSTVYTAANAAVNAYLTGLSPAYNDLTQNTTIVRADANAVWNSYYAAKVALLNAIAAKSATLATWASVSGAGRPADNATVGANAANLQVGIGGRNMLANSLPNSTAGFAVGYSAGIVLASGGLQYGSSANGCDIYSRTRQSNVFFNASGTPAAAGYCDMYLNASPNRMLAVAGQRYEFGVDLSVHRCHAKLVVAWYNAAGTYLGENDGNTNTGDGAVYTAGIAFPRSTVFLTAPATTASCMVFVRSTFLGGSAEPYVFASEWYAGIALASQTVPSAWTEMPALSSANTAQAQATANTAVSNAAAAQGAANSAATNAALANAELANIASDNVLSKVEKMELLIKWDAISAEWSDILAKADAATVSRVTYYNSLTALSAYLGSLSPAFNDVTTNTSISGLTFRTMFSDYYTARSALLNAIAVSYAAADISLILTGSGIVQNGNSVTRSGGSLWNASAHSRDGHTGGAWCSASVVPGGDVMFGLNSNSDLTDAGYATLDFAWYTSGGNMYVYVSGANQGAYGGTTTGVEIFGVSSDGTNVRFTKDGAVLLTVPSANSALKLNFDSSFVNGTIKNIRFGAMSSNAWTEIGGDGKAGDNATVGPADGATALGMNPQFSAWSTGNSFPTGWVAWSGAAPVKETGTVRTAPFAVKWAVTGDHGMSATALFTATPQSVGNYIRGSFDVNITANNGGTCRPGYLFRLHTNSAATTYVDTIVPASPGLLGWQRVPFTASVGTGQQIFGLTVYQMASWSGMTSGSSTVGSVCVFDNLTFDFVQVVSLTQIAPPNLGISGMPSDIFSYGHANSNYLVAIDSFAVSASGGVGPYTYSWSLESSTTAANVTKSASTGASCSLNAKGTNASYTGSIRCTATDSQGRVFIKVCTFDIGFGTPP